MNQRPKELQLAIVAARTASPSSRLRSSGHRVITSCPSVSAGRGSTVTCAASATQPRTGWPTSSSRRTPWCGSCANVYRIPDRRGQSPPAFAFSAPLPGGGASKDHSRRWRAYVRSSYVFDHDGSVGAQRPSGPDCAGRARVRSVGCRSWGCFRLARACPRCSGVRRNCDSPDGLVAIHRQDRVGLWPRRLRRRVAREPARVDLEPRSPGLDAPRFAQRTHHPPVESVWPDQPPR